MPNVVARRLSGLPAFRRIALGTWSDPADPSIYGVMAVRMEESLRFIEEVRARTGRRLTVTHLVIKALGQALHACPQANVVKRWGGLYQRPSVDISALVFTGDAAKPDLSAAKLEGVDRMSALDIAEALAIRAATIRAGKDRALERTRRSLLRVPGLLMRTVLKLITFLTYTLNLDLSRLGVPRDAFGSAVVTSLGSLGIETAFVPLIAYTRVPLVLAPGRVTDAPVVDGDRVVPGKVMNISATFDHRMIDGALAARIAVHLREILEDPFTHLGMDALRAAS